MARYSLTGHLQGPLSEIWDGSVFVVWDDGEIITPDPYLTMMLESTALIEVDVELLPLPARAARPYLADHATSLAWLRRIIFQPGHEAHGDLEDPEMAVTPDIRRGPVEDRMIVVA